MIKLISLPKQRDNVSSKDSWFNRQVAALAVTFCTILGSPSAAVEVTIKPMGLYRHGSVGGAEIVAHDATTQRLFVVNGEAHAIDVLDISDVSDPKLYERVRINQRDTVPTHVQVQRGIVAVSLAAADNQSPGFVVLFDVEGNELACVEVGYLPDMLTFTPDGQSIVVACEGEPDATNERDPEGSISLIDLSRGPKVGPADVTRIGFEKFYDRNHLPNGMRVSRNCYVPQDLEPEYLTVSRDGQRAWVVLQENNAIAIVNLAEKRVERLIGLGYKDHSRSENALDACNADQRADIRTWPIFGMYQPDAIASFEHLGRTYLITANEGDMRVNEEVRVCEIKLDENAFANAEKLQSPEQLGNLLTTRSMGDTDGDGDHDKIFTSGTRSFSIWSDQGELLFDSGDEFERITAKLLGDEFNSDQSPTGGFDQRSDERGPEPECVDVGEVGGRRFAFIGLERVGGIMAYDVTNPRAPQFAGYVNSMDASGSGEYRQLTDSGPEGIRFISAFDSPNNKPLLAVAFEASGTSRIFELSLATNLQLGQQ